MLNTAKSYLRLGLSIIPINRETKIPAVDWKIYQDRFMTEQELDIFKDSALDIGIVTGEISGIFVLDVDLQHPEAVEFMKGKHVPRTWTEKTKNGNHYYFRYTAELANKKTLTRAILAPGVDSRGNKGIVKCAPSLGYSWIVSPFGTPLAPPPQWLVDLLPNKDDVPASVGNTQPGQEPWMIESLNTMVDGDSLKGRNPTFLKVVNSLKRKGLEAPVVEAFLMPWAEKHNYTGKLIKLIQDQYKRYPAPKQEVVTDDDSDSFIEFMSNVTRRPVIVPGLIGQGTINILAGIKGSMKSWVALDLAVSLALGDSWLGRFKCEKKRVMFIDQERDKEEMQRRLSALVAAREKPLSALEGNFIPKVETRHRINLEPSYLSICKKIEAVQPDVLIIDSLKSIQNLNIKEDRDMQIVFEQFKQLRAKYGLTILIVHHETKGAYSRAREGFPVTSEFVSGSSVITEVPEGVFIVDALSKTESMIYHDKNSCGGVSQDPFMVKVEDLKPDQSQITVRAY